MFRPVLLFALLSAVPAAAQIQTRPTDPPFVDAASESWYQRGEPIQYAGELYYPAGATVFFNGHHMVRTGHYNGVPLYADTTIEPFSIVYVPVGRGLMQPYERLRRGELAGTTGSRPPSFPVRVTPDAGALPAAPVAPTTPPQPIGAVSAYTPDVTGDVDVDVPDAVGTSGAVETSGAASAVRPIEQTPVVTLRRPESNDGIWIRFGGEKWVSAGPAVPLTAAGFVRVGEHAGFPVFARRSLDEDVIYLPTRAGLVAPYRLKK